MTTSSNLSQVNLNPLSDESSYFNNYFLPNYTVSSEVDAATVSFFETMTNDKTSAKILASAVIFTSLSQNIDPMSTLKEFSTIPANKLNAYIAMFLNLNRIGTSILGVNNQQTVSKYIQRCILV